MLRPSNTTRGLALKRNPKAGYRVYLFPGLLGWHRMQQLHAAASGHAAAVKLPEAKHKNPHQAFAEHRRAVLCMYAQMLVLEGAERERLFKTLLQFIKIERNPVGLAGPILTSLGYFAATGNEAAYRVILYLLGTKPFKADLASYKQPIPVLDVHGKTVGVVSGEQLVGRLANKSIQQSLAQMKAHQAELQGSLVSGRTGLGENSAASPLGSLNITFGEEADAAKGACVAGVVIFSAVAGAVVFGTVTTGSAGIGTGPGIASGLGVASFLSASGTAICNAALEKPAGDTPTGPTSPDAGSPVTDAGGSEGEKHDGGPEGEKHDGGTEGEKQGGGSESGSDDEDDEFDIFSPDEPEPDYSGSEEGFEAGDWDGGGGDGSSGGLNYGAIPQGGDPGADGWASGSSGGGSLNTSRLGGGGDPLDVETYGGDALNPNALIPGNIDPNPAYADISREAVYAVGISAASSRKLAGETFSSTAALKAVVDRALR